MCEHKLIIAYDKIILVLSYYCNCSYSCRSLELYIWMPRARIEVYRGARKARFPLKPLYRTDRYRDSHILSIAEGRRDLWPTGSVCLPHHASRRPVNMGHTRFTWNSYPHINGRPSEPHASTLQRTTAINPSFEECRASGFALLVDSDTRSLAP